jgi:NADP-dependent 3-hydroxy acid dehydrogenase YdfG
MSLIPRLSRGSCSIIGGVGIASLTSSYRSECISSSTASSSSSNKLVNLKDKCVLITGASVGIGKACAERFAEHDCRLILLGRREELLTSLKKELIDKHPKLKVHTVSISVNDTKAIQALPSTLPKEFRDVSILVNNAGLALGVTTVDNNNVEDAKTVIDTNVMGVIALCSAFLPGMKERGEGHLVNMGSVAGHYAYTSGSVYNASKYAVRGFTEAARHDLAGTPIRVTHISPGLVSNTEFSNVRLKDDEKAKLVYDNIEALLPEDVADNVIYAVTRPAHVQIADIIVYCTNQSGPRDLARVGKGLGK